MVPSSQEKFVLLFVVFANLITWNHDAARQPQEALSFGQARWALGFLFWEEFFRTK